MRPLLAELTKELEPYAASPTWTPTVSASNEGFSVGWVALGALGGAALVVLALWQLGSLPFCARRRAAWCGRAAQGVGLVLSTLLMVAGAPGPLNTPVNVTAALGFETAQACPLPLQTGPRIRDP